MAEPDRPVGVVTVLADPRDVVASSASASWAIGRLAAALAARGVDARVAGLGEAWAGGPVVVAAGGSSALARAALAANRLTMPDDPESVAILRAEVGGRAATIAVGGGPRGLVYALLELADRVACAPDAAEAVRQLQVGAPRLERPANPVRSVLRTLASDVGDLGWFHDPAFWDEYLTELATHRFNRFHLALGIGFDFAVRMRDSYFYFPYPFLFEVPGYDVRATGVSAEEQARNLASLRHLAAEVHRRGLHFQLGLWAQVYEFEDSPDVNHRIEGLTPENHAAYCRDAIAKLLADVPEIDGLTLRVHGESGIPEGSYGFWETLFEGIAGAGRTVELDLHSKGIDSGMIDLALATGQPVVVSPKFWAEHMGLPYHQTDIRAVEHPAKPTGEHAVLMAVSVGERRFTRYGYADLLAEDRRFGVVTRVWPGTHRLLLWGDPATGAAYSRAFGFGGMLGAELFEPLSMYGRRGSGLPCGRDPYFDPSLRPAGPHAEWHKYAYSYRLWGRLLYDPDAEPEAWRRYLRHQLGGAAADTEAALASASRILPLVTTAHHPSAANNRYWPEIYTDMPIVHEERGSPYRDTAEPRTFGNVSALDPETFSSAEEHAAEVLRGEPSGRYSPLDVARWLDQLAGEAERGIKAAQAAGDARSAELRRVALDVEVEAALGRFYAGKLRAAAGYAFFERTGDLAALREAVNYYRAAREAWTRVVELTEPTYRHDLAYGPEPFLRGHWRDRAAAIDGDLGDMKAALRRAEADRRRSTAPAGLRERLEAPTTAPGVRHEPPASFTPGEPLGIAAEVEASWLRLRYRHVTHAERFQVAEMPGEAGRFRAEIPGDYTRSPYQLQYFFEGHGQDGRAWRWPGLGADLTGTPYLVVRAGTG